MTLTPRYIGGLRTSGGKVTLPLPPIPKGWRIVRIDFEYLTPVRCCAFWPKDWTHINALAGRE